MEDRPRKQLLGLPAELRLHIYSYVIPAIPLHAPRSEYTGLVYSCRQTRAEMTPMILARMCDTFASISKESLDDWNEDVNFGNPQDLHELENLVVERRVKGEMHMTLHPLLRLLDMHFDLLSIRLFRSWDSETTVKKRTAFPHFMIRRFINDGDHGDLPKVQILDYDWSQAMGTHKREHWVPTHYLNNIHLHKDWLMSVRANEEGQQVAIRLERMRGAAVLMNPAKFRSYRYEE
jgi:hypothetical protein